MAMAARILILKIQETILMRALGLPPFPSPALHDVPLPRLPPSKMPPILRKKTFMISCHIIEEHVMTMAASPPISR
eukprot:scaffold3030_cov106-Skeletonema_marinoi.AAC.6